MIQFSNVSLSKETRVILKKITCTLSQKRIGIIGENGSGKSTFARLLNALELPTSGVVTVGGLNTLDDKRAVRRKVGFVFQNPDNQIVYPIVREDLAFGLKNYKIPKRESEQVINEGAQKLGLAHLLDRQAHTLSGGEKQMVAILGVLLIKPEIIVLDEPTTLLDLKNKKRIMDMLKTVLQTVIVVSHDLDFLSDFDRILLIENGTIAADGTPEIVIPQYREKSLC